MTSIKDLGNGSKLVLTIFLLQTVGIMATRIAVISPSAKGLLMSGTGKYFKQSLSSESLDVHACAETSLNFFKFYLRYCT